MPETEIPEIIISVVGSKKGPKDLVGEAKESMAKETKSKARKQKRIDLSRRGQTGGRSNQDVRGAHNTNTTGGGRHDKRNRRAKREQKNATQSKINGHT